MICLGGHFHGANLVLATDSQTVLLAIRADASVYDADPKSVIAITQETQLYQKMTYTRPDGTSREFLGCKNISQEELRQIVNHYLEKGEPNEPRKMSGMQD